MEQSIVTEEQAREYLARGYWGRATQLDYLYRHAQTMPQREALVDSRRRLNYAGVVCRVERLALTLHEHGIGTGDRVGVQLGPCVDGYIANLAIQAVGGISVHLHLRSREADWGHVLRITEPSAMLVPAEGDFVAMAAALRSAHRCVRLVLVSGGSAPAGMTALDAVFTDRAEQRHPQGTLQSLRPDPGTPWTIMSSSGTTGVPKFTIVSYYPSLYISRCLAEKLRMDERDVALIISPGGPGGVVASPAGIVGARILFQERFDAQAALEIAQRERATIIAGTATQFIKMLEIGDIGRKYDLSSLRIVTNAAATLAPEIVQRFEQQSGARMMNIFGTTDAGVPAATGLDDLPEVTLRTAGRPFPGVEMRIVDEHGKEVAAGESGEIVWRGPCMYGGYYRNDSLNKTKYRDGWYISGDLGSIDAQGYLSVSGRKDHTINRGGQKVSPAEIEELLYQHPKVKEVVVVPMPDAVLGQKACAYVVPRAGASFGFEEMIGFLKSRGMAVYKLPERLEIASGFPVTGGIPRVMRKALMEDIAGKLAREGAHDGV